MFDQFREAIYDINPDLTEEEWMYLQSSSQEKVLPKKAYFIQAGEIQTVVGFVASGLLRGYYVNEAGEEVTIRFVRENEYATHYAALLNEQPSMYSFQCLEPSHLILLPLARMREGYDRYKGIERFGRLIAEQVLSFQANRIQSLQFLNAEERYRNFITRNPGLFNRISLSHLATYLGMQRPSLSRIRKKIAES